MEGNPAKVWESLNSPFEKKNTKLSRFFFPLLRVNLRQKTQSPDPWEAGRKNGKGHFGWSDGSMYEACGLGLPTGWRGSLGVWGMYISYISLSWSAFRSFQALAPLPSFDIFGLMSPVSLFWDLTRMAFHNVAGRVCWQWHQRLWRLQMGAGRRVRVNHHFPRSWCVRHPGIHPTSTYWFCTYHLDEFRQKKANERYQRIECL